MFVSQRDIISISRVIAKPDGSLWTVSCSYSHTSMPEQDGVIRAKLLFGGNVITPMGENQCMVTYLLASDPCGSLPEFALAIAAVSQPKCIAVIRNFIKNNSKFLGPIVENV